MPKPTKLHRIPPAILQGSRDFRHPLTPKENMVWQAVRRRQLGFKICRQHLIGRFVADFRRETRSFFCGAQRARRGKAAG